MFINVFSMILPVGMAENGANLLPAMAFFQSPENAGVPHVGTDPSRSDTCRGFEIDWVWFLGYPHVPMMAIARRKSLSQDPQSPEWVHVRPGPPSHLVLGRYGILVAILGGHAGDSAKFPVFGGFFGGFVEGMNRMWMEKQSST